MPRSQPSTLTAPRPLARWAAVRARVAIWAVAAAVVAAALGAGGCADMGSGAAMLGPTWDGGAGAADTVGADWLQGPDATADTSNAPDQNPGEDTGSTDVGPDVRPDGAGKTDNPTPPAGPSRSSVTLDGHRAAWVEVSPSGERALVTWDLDTPEEAPTPYAWPYLVQPQGLALAGGWLVFEDTPYNDADVFALRLADGAVHGVVTLPGPQRSPAALPDTGGGAGQELLRVAWEDCRSCLAGDDPRPEIYLRGVTEGATEQRLTADDVADRGPSAGTLADGSPGLVWLSGDADARVWSGGATQTVPLPFTGAAGVALTRGMLASRPSPLIINPDSMMPSDVFLTDLATLQTRRLSTHAELTAQAPAAPVAQGGRVAWVEAVAGAPASARDVVVVDVDDPSVELLRAPLLGVSAIAVSGAWVGATVPAAGAQSDVWFQAAP